ncbi:MAG: hypothetical protein KF860_14805 [Cyclobacteriaceae bacterium]|nr:hypothetical protein [Cyclobacteriaceae bacterium]
MRRLEDFSICELSKFDEMHKILTEYNVRLGTDDEMPMPKYSDDEMAEYSGYREMVITKECEDW